MAKNTAPPSKLQVNDDLEQARPLSVNEFLALKEESVKPTDFDDTAAEFYHDIVDLARNIKRDEQYHAVQVRRSGMSVELITGYRRYLACLYLGQEVKYENVSIDDADIFDRIFAENEQRQSLEPRARAEVIAKRLGRFDPDGGGLLPASTDDTEVTLTELSDRYGKSRGQMYRYLSPLRQSQEMRDEFGDVLSESDLSLIEQITDDESEQHTLAEARTQSDIDTYTEFKELTTTVQNDVDDPEDIVEVVTKELLDLDSSSVKGAVDEESWKTNQQQLEDSARREKKQEKRQNDESVSDESASGDGSVDEHRVPDTIKNALDGGFGRDTPLAKELGYTDEDDDVEESAESTEDGEGTTTDETSESTNTGDVETSSESVDGSSDETLMGAGQDNQSVSESQSTEDEESGSRSESEVIELLLNDSELCQLVSEDANDRGDEPNQVVRDILTVYYRRKGRLSGVSDVFSGVSSD